MVVWNSIFLENHHQTSHVTTDYIKAKDTNDFSCSMHALFTDSFWDVFSCQI